MARQSRYTLPINLSRQNPKRPSDGQALMLRAGLIGELGEGIYTWLPAGWRAHQQVVRTIRAEMASIGAHEVLIPVLQPAELRQQSGRLDDPDVFSLTDRTGSRLVLAKGDEEAITRHVANVVQSYRDLPLAVYQLQVAERDTQGRAREAVTLRAYSFDQDADGMRAQVARFRGAFDRILERCGVEFGRVSGAGVEDSDRYQARRGGAWPAAPTRPASADIDQVLHEQALNVGECAPIGTVYSRALDGQYTDAHGQERNIFMGSYVLDPGRIVLAAVEQFADEHGISWPVALAPFTVHLVSQAQPGTPGEQLADWLYGALVDGGLSVLYDDREAPSEVKVADAELLGLPLRLTIAPHSTDTALAAVDVRRGRASHAGLLLARDAHEVAAR